MSKLKSPADEGFSPELAAMDRAQIALLREMAAQQGGRLILKGGMAMRVTFGSARMTKDLDFDRDPTLSQDALKRGLVSTLQRAAASTGIKGPPPEITKDTRTTVRARLQGNSLALPVRIEVEVSGRAAPSSNTVRSVVVSPPLRYAMAPFSVMTYTVDALAAMKVAAALSDQRNAPRDIYDLRDLIRAGVDPTALLSEQDEDLLRGYAANPLSKLELSTFALAQQELLPYLPPAERDALTEDAWLEATLLVGEAIKRWCDDALRLKAQSDAPGDETPAVDRDRPK